MKWLKKLFSNDPSPDDGRQSPPGTPKQSIDQRRAPRVKISTIDSAKVDLIAPLEAKGLSVNNISTLGIGVVASPEMDSQIQSIKKDMPFTGTLWLRGNPLAIEGKWANVFSNRLGGAFTRTPPGFPRTLQEYFSTEFRALELVRVNPSLLKKEPQGEPRWFRGKDQIDLFYVWDRGNILRLTFSCFGSYFELEPSVHAKLKFGTILEENPEDAHARYKGSELVQWKSEVPIDMVHIALRLIENIPSIPPEELDVLRRVLRAG